MNTQAQKTLQLTYDAQMIADLSVRQIAEVGYTVGICVEVENLDVFYVVTNPLDNEEEAWFNANNTVQYELFDCVEMFLAG